MKYIIAVIAILLSPGLSLATYNNSDPYTEAQRAIEERLEIAMQDPNLEPVLNSIPLDNEGPDTVPFLEEGEADSHPTDMAMQERKQNLLLKIRCFVHDNCPEDLSLLLAVTPPHLTPQELNKLRELLAFVMDEGGEESIPVRVRSEELLAVTPPHLTPQELDKLLAFVMDEESGEVTPPVKVKSEEQLAFYTGTVSQEDMN